MRENPGANLGHELRDASPRPVLIFAIFLLVVLVFVHWLAFRSLRFLESREDLQYRADFPTNPLSQQMPGVPPDPRLEPEPSHDQLPIVDLQAVQSRQQSLIGSSAWGYVDPSRHFARIPIQQAIDMAVTSGLPDVLPATQPSAPPGQPPASAAHGPGGLP
jgi:hypothetical protein